MISSFISRKVRNDESITNKQYGWHVVSGSVGKKGSEITSLSTTVDCIRKLKPELRHVQGISNVLCRQFEATFTLNGSEKALKVLVFRCIRGRENRYKQAVKDFVEGGPKVWFSMNTVHKLLLGVLALMYFLSRFGCHSTSTEQPAVNSGVMFKEEEEVEQGYYDKFCTHKNYYLYTVGITFLMMTAIKFVFDRLNKKR